MAGSHESSSHRYIKICPRCPGLQALDKVLLSWGTKYRQRFCGTCGTILHIYEQISLYDSSRLTNSYIGRVKICTTCPPSRAGLSLSWTGSIRKHEARRDCRYGHASTFEYVHQTELHELHDVSLSRSSNSSFPPQFNSKIAESARGVKERRPESNIEGNENRSTPNSIIDKKRELSPSEEQRCWKKPRTQTPNQKDAILRPVNENFQASPTPIFMTAKPKKTFTETRLDIALAIASKVAFQTTPEYGIPALDFFGPVFTPPPPRISTIRRRASEFIFTTRNERTYNELTALRRVSFADHVETRDEEGRKAILKELMWKTRPGAGKIGRELLIGREELIALQKV